VKPTSFKWRSEHDKWAASDQTYVRSDSELSRKEPSHCADRIFPQWIFLKNLRLHLEQRNIGFLRQIFFKPGTVDAVDVLGAAAYSRPSLPLIPDEACHPFHANAATDSTAKLPPWQAA